MAVDPRGRDLTTFLADDPGGPVITPSEPRSHAS
jgi:hypothetical protein